MVYNVSIKFLKKNQNLSLNVGYFHFAVSSRTFFRESWLAIFVLAKPSQTILSIDRSETRFERHTGGKTKKIFKKTTEILMFFVNFPLNQIQIVPSRSRK